jgi:hypothetical protein
VLRQREGGGQLIPRRQMVPQPIIRTSRDPHNNADALVAERHWAAYEAVAERT